ncbi:MAG: TetR/AcrR family transcriptional regulator [Bacteroidota bacterium]
MGIADRKEREKKEMRELILKTATNLFIEKGYEKTSMRNIAEAIEYSPATIYLYFKDKNELFYALSEEGFRKFFSYLGQVSDQINPIERLKILGRAYVKFALTHPGYYDLMFILRAPMETSHTETGWELGMKSHGVLTGIVADCINDGHFKGKNPEQVAFMIWSLVHGIVSFKIRDRLKMYEDHDHDELLYGALDVFDTMLERI